MAASAFRSTSKRGTYTGSSVSNGKECRQEDLGHGQPNRRSRSVNPASRRAVEESAAASSFLKRDNPLFNSPSMSPKDLDGYIGASKADDDRVSDGRRGRPVSRGPGGSGGRGHSSSTRQGIGRSLSRVDTGRTRRSVSRGPSVKSEGEREKEQVRSLSSAMHNKLSKTTAPPGQSRSDVLSGLRRPTRNSQSEATWCQTSNVLGSAGETMEYENHHGFYPQGEGPMRSVSEQLKAIQRMNQAYISDADVPYNSLELMSRDNIELIYEIRREYALQLEQSEERVRKLQADLDVEEQRRQELSRILFDVLPDPKASGTHRLKHKASIERREMSKRLTEEAFSYFDECVSISTFDGSDLSSFDDPVSCSVHSQVGSHPINGVSRASDTQIRITPSDDHEGLLDQSRSFLSSADSNVTTPNSKDSITKQHQILGCGLSPSNDNYQFSFVGKEIQQLIKKSVRGKSECGEQVGRSGVSCDPFDCSNIQMLAETVLYDRVALQREIDFGGLLLCDFKTI